MKKALFILLAVSAFTAGCGRPAEEPETLPDTTAEESPLQEEATTGDYAQEEAGEEIIEEPLQEEPGAVQETPVQTVEPDSLESRLEGLIENEYEGIEISAAILPRMAILPGMTIPVTVVIQNTGDQTIVYTQGSGSYETPEALLLDAGGLQWIKPQDQLGVVTSDFMVKELKPSEELKYTLFIKAIKENKAFDLYTNEIFDQDQAYAGDLEWETLKEAYPDLEAAAPGSYEGAVYFRYLIANEEGINLFGDNTGYAKAPFATTINE